MSGFKWGKRWWGFGIAVASAGPYANNLHLAACSRWIITSIPHHSILQAACSFWRPTNSDKALKALISQVNQQKITYCCFFTSSKHSKTEQHRQHVNTILHGHKPNKYILYTATVTVAQLFILHPYWETDGASQHNQQSVSWCPYAESTEIFSAGDKKLWLTAAASA